MKNSASLNTLKRNFKTSKNLVQRVFLIFRISFGIKPITRLLSGLSHLHEHKFGNYFQDTLNYLCECGKDIQ